MRTPDSVRVVRIALRLSLAAAFLSAVADRFGWWEPSGQVAKTRRRGNLFGAHSIWNRDGCIPRRENHPLATVSSPQQAQPRPTRCLARHRRTQHPKTPVCTDHRK